MENLGLGVQLMVIGMVTVFIILALVIILGKGLISISNRFPEKAVAPQARPQAAAPQVSAKTKAVIEAAVSQITGGKGHVTNITKL